MSVPYRIHFSDDACEVLDNLNQVAYEQTMQTLAETIMKMAQRAEIDFGRDPADLKFQVEYNQSSFYVIETSLAQVYIQEQRWKTLRTLLNWLKRGWSGFARTSRS